MAERAERGADDGVHDAALSRHVSIVVPTRVVVDGEPLGHDGRAVVQLVVDGDVDGAVGRVRATNAAAQLAGAACALRAIRASTRRARTR